MIPVIDSKAVGQRIKRARVSRGWHAARDLAEACGLAVGTIGSYEAGLRLPSRDTLVSLSVALRRTMDWLLLGRNAGAPKKRIEGNRGGRPADSTAQPDHIGAPAVFE